MKLPKKKQHSLESALAKASRRSIEEITSDLRNNWQNGHWIKNDNRYRRDPIHKISEDLESNGGLHHVDLSQYVTASAFTHCLDGWAFLGRALNAQIVSDSDTARHLGYYAELRAAMSLLASEGIGVFGNRHISVTGSKECVPMAQTIPTHQFVWPALETWAASREGVKTILKAIKPGGIDLVDWLDQFGGGPISIGIRWMEQWGLDLSRLVGDRTARNISTYRPTAFTSPGATTIGNIVSMISEFWKFCEPIGSRRFALMDDHLLDQSLAILGGSADEVDRNSLCSTESYRNRVKAMLSSLGLSLSAYQSYEAFLLKPTTQDRPQLLESAAGRADKFHKNHVNEVLARALILLRIATGSSAQLFFTQFVRSEELEFWWQGSLVRRGLWARNRPPSSTLDLWEDIEDALQTVSGWMKDCKHGRTVQSYHSFRTHLAFEGATLSTTERVCLWGLNL